METRRFRCLACKKLKTERVKGQRYCGDPACQKARKNTWRRQKYATDVDYYLNQKQSTKTWLASKGGAATYYRDYRKRRKAALDQERQCTKGPPSIKAIGGAQRAMSPSANSDASLRKSPIKTGRYWLCPESANSDAIWVEIKAISTG
jgi:hypothetical protein